MVNKLNIYIGHGPILGGDKRGGITTSAMTQNLNLRMIR